MDSASIPSVNELKLVTSGISDVAIATVHSEKKHMKKMIMIVQVTDKPFIVNEKRRRRDG